MKGIPERTLVIAADPVAEACELMRAQRASLSILHLSNIPLSCAQAKRLAGAMKRDPAHLRVLFLDGCSLTEYSRDLLQSLPPSLQYLYLQDNPELGNQALENMLHLPQLLVLNLARNNISNVAPLVQFLRRPECTLKGLRLSQNMLGTEQLLALVDSLNCNKSLVRLEIHGNVKRNKRDSAAAIDMAITNVLSEKNTTLRHFKFFRMRTSKVSRLDVLLQLNKLGRAHWGSDNVPSTAWHRRLAAVPSTSAMWVLIRSHPNIFGKRANTLR